MVSAPGNSPAIGTQTLSSHRVYGRCLYAVRVEERLQLNKKCNIVIAVASHWNGTRGSGVNQDPAVRRLSVLQRDHGVQILDLTEAH